MLKIEFKWLIILFMALTCAEVYSQQYLEVQPKKGDGISSLLKRYLIKSDNFNIQKFKIINEGNLDSKGNLVIGSKYKLPVEVYKFNGKNIRTSANINDYDIAKKIDDYNIKVVKQKVKSKLYKIDKLIWVPLEITENNTGTDIQEKLISNKKRFYEPLYGKNFENVKILNRKLQNNIFYIISGHGGPDPGAIGNKNGHELHEDEYAYDVCLRLARKLNEFGAETYIIIQDSADGIRDVQYLNNSSSEINLDKSVISADQVERLSKRVSIVNSLYETNLDKNIKQYAVEIHVDSRYEGQNIDIFFYHKDDSEKGKKLAETMLNTIEKKYEKAQPGRGYEGTVSSRNLYMVRNLKPTTVFIEIGNIQNPKDQIRIIEPNNRQAIANWLTDGIVNFTNKK